MLKAKWTANSVYLYNYGNENSTVTGGWGLDGYNYSGYLSGSKNNNFLDMKVLKQSSGIARWLYFTANNNISINFNTLEVEYAHVVSWDNLNQFSCGSFYSILPASSSKTTVSIDISEIYGTSCKPSFAIYTGTYHNNGEYLYIYKAQLK